MYFNIFWSIVFRYYIMFKKILVLGWGEGLYLFFKLFMLRILGMYVLGYRLVACFLNRIIWGIFKK